MRIRFIAMCVAVSVLMGSATGLMQSPGLRIVVVEGEDAVNIIQQKTATAPVIEVRDQNNLPVAGASVTFALQGTNATFAGASSITVVTNAAGQATAAGLTPVTGGVLQINVQAAFQGQTAVAAITQTNVLNAAQAAALGGQAGAGGAAPGAAATGGGGLSNGALIGIIGGVGAAATAAVAAGQGASDQSSATNVTTPPATAAPATPPSPSPAPTPPPAPPPTTTTPPAATVAALTITVAPNPAPYSGAPVTQFAVCNGVRDTWFYVMTISETAGVAATLTRVVDRRNGSVLNDEPRNIRIGGKGSTNINYSWCFGLPAPHLISSTWSATDANGNALTVNAPDVTLLPRPASFTIEPTRDPVRNLGGGGGRQQ